MEERKIKTVYDASVEAARAYAEAVNAEAAAWVAVGAARDLEATAETVKVARAYTEAADIARTEAARAAKG